MQMLRDVRQRHAKLPRDPRRPSPRMRRQVTRDLILSHAPHKRPRRSRTLARQRRARRQQPPALSQKLASLRKLRIKLGKPRVDLRKHATRASSPIGHQRNLDPDTPISLTRITLYVNHVHKLYILALASRDPPPRRTAHAGRAPPPPAPTTGPPSFQTPHACPVFLPEPLTTQPHSFLTSLPTPLPLYFSTSLPSYLSSPAPPTTERCLTTLTTAEGGWSSTEPPNRNNRSEREKPQQKAGNNWWAMSAGGRRAAAACDSVRERRATCRRAHQTPRWIAPV